MKLLINAIAFSLILAAVPMAALADVAVVPELNPSSAVSAVTLLSGFALLVRNRLRRR